MFFWTMRPVINTLSLRFVDLAPHQTLIASCVQILLEGVVFKISLSHIRFVTRCSRRPLDDVITRRYSWNDAQTNNTRWREKWHGRDFTGCTNPNLFFLCFQDLACTTGSVTVKVTTTTLLPMWPTIGGYLSNELAVWFVLRRSDDRICIIIN